MSREYSRNLLEEFCLHYSWRFVEKLPERAFLVKRISYLACDDTDTLILPRASRFTNDERRRTQQRIGIAAEAFMNIAGREQKGEEGIVPKAGFEPAHPCGR